MKQTTITSNNGQCRKTSYVKNGIHVRCAPDMSTNENITSNRNRPSEKLTLFSICCPCLRPKKLTCRASDIALVMYDKDEPHEYVLEKLVIKRVPLRFFGVEEDFAEYERSLKEESKTTCEKEIAVTNFDEIKSVEVEAVKDEKSVEVHEVPHKNSRAYASSLITMRNTLDFQEIEKQPSQEMEMEAVQAVTSGNSLKVNCNTPVEEFLQSKLSFACEPLTEPKSGEELILRTITANEEEDLVTEVDQRIAKMSPDLEHTINVLKGVKPRPVSTQGTPMPIKNQRRLVPRNVEHEGIITKGAYNYMPCPKDNPLLGIHYTLNKTTFAPHVEETSKSIITDLHIDNTIDQDSKVATSIMIDEATTNYEDATVLAADDVSTIRPSMFHIPSIRNLSDEEDYIRSDYSSDSTNFQGTFGSKRFGSFFNKPHEQKTDFGTTDFSVYHAEVAHRFGRRVPPSRSSKKRNLKWKIVINNHPKDVMAPTTSTSEFQLSNSRKSPCKGYVSKSGLSF